MSVIPLFLPPLHSSAPPFNPPFNDPLLPPLSLLLKPLNSQIHAHPITTLLITITILVSLTIAYSLAYKPKSPRSYVTGVPHMSSSTTLLHLLLRQFLPSTLAPSHKTNKTKQPLGSKISSRSLRLDGPYGMYTSDFYNTTILNLPTYESCKSVLKGGEWGDRKGGEYGHFKDTIFGDSVFTEREGGKRWRVKRRVLNHSMFGNMGGEGIEDVVDEVWRDRGGRLAGDDVGVLEWGQGFSRDFITRYLTGVRIMDDLKEGTSKVGEFLMASNRLRTLVLGVSRDPMYRLLPGFVYYNVTGKGREARRLSETCRCFARYIAKNAKVGSPVHRWLSNSDGVVSDLSGYEVSELTTLLFAGTDTTSSTISWLMCEVKVEDQEVVRRTEGKGRVRDAMIKESSRLHPAAPFVVRVVPEGAILGDERDGLRVKARGGVTAVCWINAANRDERVYGRDAGEWRWRRWLEDGNLGGVETMQFGGGGRKCLGQGVAKRVVRRLFERITEEKRWGKVGGVEGEEGGGFTDTPERGGRVWVRDG